MKSTMLLKQSKKMTDAEFTEVGDEVFNCLYGYTKDEIEIIFERYVLPIYTFAARRPKEKSDWKIENRLTGNEFEDFTNGKKLLDVFNK